MTIEENLAKIKENILIEKKISSELNYLFTFLKNPENKREEKMVNRQIEKLENLLSKINDEILVNLEQANISAPLKENKPEKVEVKESEVKIKKHEKKEKSSVKLNKTLSAIDKEILKRLKRKQGEKIVEKVSGKISDYTKFANNIFLKSSMSLIKQKIFKNVGRDLIKANMNYSLTSYVSIILFNTTIALILSFILFLFLLFFNLSPVFPIISKVTESIGIRFLKIFWIPILAPIGTFMFMNYYPSLEKKSLGGKIDAELPFAAIHMAAISGSMIDPTKIFSIIASTKEYPNLEKEFNKLLNEINVYGYDLVTALKDLALNTSSPKLSELLNGLSTTITSGGSLYEFFEKRAQSLLFEYRLDKEKSTKTAETFMDIYISVVIAAPMIFMLLLMMMKISGLGISLSTSTITFLVVGAVSVINVFFIMFLQVKQQSTG